MVDGYYKDESKNIVDSEGGEKISRYERTVSILRFWLFGELHV